MTLTPGATVRRGLAASGLTCVLAASVLVSSMSLAHAAQSQGRGRSTSSPKLERTLGRLDAWDTMLADVTIRRGRVDAKGRPVGPSLAPMSFRFERSRSAVGEWKTALRLPARERELVTINGAVPTTARRATAAVELADDGRTLRLVDDAGIDLPPPTRESVAHVGRLLNEREPVDLTRLFGSSGARRLSPRSDGWIESMAPTRAGRADRRAALERIHGPSVGRVRGLDRFVTSEGTSLREVLVDPELALPREINEIEDGRLVAHHTVIYAPMPDGAWVRRAMRSERLAGAGSGERSTLDIEFVNLRFERRN